MVIGGSAAPKGVIQAYKERHEARPAFQKARGDQMATFAANAPA